MVNFSEGFYRQYYDLVKHYDSLETPCDRGVGCRKVASVSLGELDENWYRIHDDDPDAELLVRGTVYQQRTTPVKVEKISIHVPSKEQVAELNTKFQEVKSLRERFTALQQSIPSYLLSSINAEIDERALALVFLEAIVSLVHPDLFDE